MEYNRYHKPTVWAGKPGRAAFSISKNWIERGDDMQAGKIHSIESMGLVDGLESVPFFFCRGADFGAVTAIIPDTWQLSGEKEMDVDQIMKMLKRYRPYYGKTGGVTCSRWGTFVTGRVCNRIVSKPANGRKYFHMPRYGRIWKWLL